MVESLENAQKSFLCYLIREKMSEESDEDFVGVTKFFPDERFPRHFITRLKILPDLLVWWRSGITLTISIHGFLFYFPMIWSLGTLKPVFASRKEPKTSKNAESAKFQT